MRLQGEQGAVERPIWEVEEKVQGQALHLSETLVVTEGDRTPLEAVEAMVSPGAGQPVEG